MARLETGIIQEGDDWPGVFIRGDHALMGYAPALAALLNGSQDPLHRAECENLLKLLRCSDAGAGFLPQRVQMS